MSLREQLGEYTYWQTKSPGEILAEVKKVGGWTSVFLGELPKWAHRVRNFFNQEPKQLNYYIFKGMDSDLYHVVMLQIGFDYKRDLALSGHTYLDERKRIWLQMSPGSTVYHFKHNLPMGVQAAIMTTRGQSGTPVFKLISPDGTNGSCETIIRNPPKNSSIALQAIAGVAVGGTGDSTIKTSIVINRIVTLPEYQGSYNYGETTVVGSPDHTRFDVTPHEKDPDGYKNPSNRFSDLYSRKFPTHDNQGNLLAELKWG